MQFKHTVFEFVCCDYRREIGMKVSCVHVNLTVVLTTLTLSESGEIISSFYKLFLLVGIMMVIVIFVIKILASACGGHVLKVLGQKL
jgi:hypothetical protein